MNLPGTAGESSCNRQENGDAKEPDRPLKKARFAWEVKGKYHLRNEMSDVKPASTIESERAGSSSQHCESKLIGNTEQNLEILGDYLLKQDFNTLDSITDSNSTLMPSSSCSMEKLSYSRYLSTFESNRAISVSSSSNDERTSVPKSLVYTNKDTEDQCIAQWQAKQIEKCFLDNVINSVLENWEIAPLPIDMDNNRGLDIHTVELINNLPCDNCIENEGILMAISAHGLQNNSSSSVNENDIENNNLHNTNRDLFLSPPSTPLPSDDEINSENKLNKGMCQMDENLANNLDMSWGFTKEVNQNNNLPLSFYPESSSSSYQYMSESDNMNSSNIEHDGDENISSNGDIVGNHYDFLDAAVSFAIQYKGLTSYGTDYG